MPDAIDRISNARERLDSLLREHVPDPQARIALYAAVSNYATARLDFYIAERVRFNGCGAPAPTPPAR